MRVHFVIAILASSLFIGYANLSIVMTTYFILNNNIKKIKFN